MSDLDENIKKVNEALNSATTPTKDRYGYVVKEDGSVVPFGPITHDEFVPTNKKNKGVKKIV